MSIVFICLLAMGVLLVFLVFYFVGFWIANGGRGRGGGVVVVKDKGVAFTSSRKRGLVVDDAFACKRRRSQCYRLDSFLEGKLKKMSGKVGEVYPEPLVVAEKA